MTPCVSKNYVDGDAYKISGTLNNSSIASLYVVVQLTDLSGLLNVELVGNPSEVRMNEGHHGGHGLLDLVSRVEQDLNPAKQYNDGQLVHVINSRHLKRAIACSR